MNDAPLQNLAQLEAALTARGLAPAAHRGAIQSLRRHMERYAWLEKKLLGHVWVTVPTHLLDFDLPDDPLEAGEQLAYRERERFGLGEGETGDVMALLDREGVKVYRPRFPRRSQVDGVFLFDGEVGPVLTVDGRLPVREGDFVFARLYGHYLVDNDPYEIRFAIRGPEPERTVSDLRAQAFAAAFLISRAGMESYLQALGHRDGELVTADMLRQLAIFFEVGFRPLLTRLLSTGVIGPQDLRPLLAELEASEEPPEPAPPGAAGERFIRLALEAHAKGLLDDDTLALFLETDLEAARVLAARFRLEEDTASVPPGGGRGPGSGRSRAAAESDEPADENEQDEPDEHYEPDDEQGDDS